MWSLISCSSTQSLHLFTLWSLLCTALPSQPHFNTQDMTVINISKRKDNWGSENHLHLGGKQSFLSKDLHLGHCQLSGLQHHLLSGGIWVLPVPPNEAATGKQNNPGQRHSSWINRWSILKTHTRAIFWLADQRPPKDTWEFFKTNPLAVTAKDTSFSGIWDVQYSLKKAISLAGKA